MYQEDISLTKEQKAQISQDLAIKKPKVKKLNPVLATNVWFTKSHLFVETNDRRIIGVPIDWFPLLENATEKQRQAFEISPSGRGIHWDEIDEDISLAGLLN